MSISLNDYLETEQQAEKILDILAKNNVQKPPVPTWIILKIMPYSTIDIISMSEEVFGFSYSKNGKSYILLNENFNYGAQRFTAFHEFYHLLYGRHRYSKNTPQGEDEEKRANFFSSCILMPARWFRREWERVKNVDKMAEIFGVSKSAVEIRLENLDHYINKN